MMKYMKSIFKIMASIAVAAVIAGCDKSGGEPVVDDNGGKDTEQDGGTQPAPQSELFIDVTGIEASQATVKAEIVSGTASSFKVVYNYPVADITFKPTNPKELKKFVDKYGVEVAELPHDETLADLPHNMEYISAVICYEDGEITGSAYKVWTSVGAIWGDETGAGSLPLNPWN